MYIRTYISVCMYVYIHTYGEEEERGCGVTRVNVCVGVCIRGYIKTRLWRKMKGLV